MPQHKKQAKQYRVPLVPGATFYIDAEIEDVGALQALMRGDAEAHQQQRALTWIIEKASGAYELSFRSKEAETNFHEGRRFVGLEIVKYIKTPMDMYKANRKIKEDLPYLKDSPGEQR